MPQLRQEGNFRGFITSYAVRKPGKKKDPNEAPSKSRAISLTVAITEIWHKGEWCDWQNEGFEVSGDMWVVKIDGTVNKTAVQDLMEYAGWDGTFASVEGGTWPSHNVHVKVESHTYNQKMEHRIAWLRGYDEQPGQRGNVSTEEIKTLDQQFGPKFRALSGDTARNAAPPAGAPPAKPEPAMAVSPAKEARATEELAQARVGTDAARIETARATQAAQATQAKPGPPPAPPTEAEQHDAAVAEAGNDGIPF